MRLALLIVIALVAPARADDGKVIALLPLAAEKKLQIYGGPVSNEVAKALEQGGFTITVVSSTAPVPSKARLVIDGRIVRGDGTTVLLEARVRDPAVGKVVAELSASAPELTRIDEAAAHLADQLAPILRDGLAAQDDAKKPKPKTKDVSENVPRTNPDTPAEPRPADTRPRARIEVKSGVRLGKDDPELVPLLRGGGERLAGLVGYRADDEGADLIVAIELLGIAYGTGGVVTARARARVRVSDKTGVVWERTVRTDTLVGGRGDRRDAVARAAIEQIVDIAMPRVRERLGSAQQ